MLRRTAAGDAQPTHPHPPAPAAGALPPVEVAGQDQQLTAGLTARRRELLQCHQRLPGRACAGNRLGARVTGRHPRAPANLPCAARMCVRPSPPNHQPPHRTAPDARRRWRHHARARGTRRTAARGRRGRPAARQAARPPLLATGSRRARGSRSAAAPARCAPPAVPGSTRARAVAAGPAAACSARKSAAPREGRAGLKAGGARCRSQAGEQFALGWRALRQGCRPTIRQAQPGCGQRGGKAPLSSLARRCPARQARQKAWRQLPVRVGFRQGFSADVAAAAAAAGGRACIRPRLLSLACRRRVLRLAGLKAYGAGRGSNAGGSGGGGSVVIWACWRLGRRAGPRAGAPGATPVQLWLRREAGAGAQQLAHPGKC